MASLSGRKDVFPARPATVFTPVISGMMAMYWLTPNFMYCVFDRNDVLLYVGISSQPEARLKDHKRNSIWYKEKTRIEITRFDDRHLALAAEAKKIKSDKPIHNLQHNPLFLQLGRKFVSCSGATT